MGDKILKAGIFISIFILCLSCKNNFRDSKTIEKDVKNFLGSKIRFNPYLVPINFSSKEPFCKALDKKYKMIIYRDSIACAECNIIKLTEWNYFRQDVNNKDFFILIVLNTSDVRNISETMDKFDINLSYCLDIDQKFKLKNKLSSQKVLHVFLTRNDTVILAGNPLNNLNLKNLYLSVLNKEK